MTFGARDEGDARLVSRFDGFASHSDRLDFLLNDGGVLTFGDTVAVEDDRLGQELGVVPERLDISFHHVLQVLNNLLSAFLQSNSRLIQVVIADLGRDGRSDGRRDDIVTAGWRVTDVGTDEHRLGVESGKILERDRVGDTTELRVNLHGDIVAILVQTTFTSQFRRKETLRRDGRLQVGGSATLDFFIQQWITTRENDDDELRRDRLVSSGKRLSTGVHQR